MQEIGLHTSELMVTARQMYERMGFCEAVELPVMFGLRFGRLVLPQTPASLRTRPHG